MELSNVGVLVGIYLNLFQGRYFEMIKNYDFFSVRITTHYITFALSVDGLPVMEAFVGRPVIYVDTFYRTGVAYANRALIVKDGGFKELMKPIELLIDNKLREMSLGIDAGSPRNSWKKMVGKILCGTNLEIKSMRSPLTITSSHR